MTPKVTCIADVKATLGEGPVWCERTQRLFFVDIKAPAIHALSWPACTLETWKMPSAVGAIALRERGGLVAALKSGFAFVDLASGAVTPIADPDADNPHNRFNDGKVDAAGRFWAGTMDDGETQATGDLFRLDPDLSVTRFPFGFVVTNGLGWTRDQRTMFFTDSAGRTIHAMAFDAASGTPGARRILAQTPEGHYPDGLCVAADDSIISAEWAGSRLTHYAPDGAILRHIAIPAPLVTSCCFGGPDLDILFVTSARIGLDAATLARFPQSGGVFAVTGLGVRGLASPRFKG